MDCLCGGWNHNSHWWRHNGRDSVSNHQVPVCLLNCLFRHRTKKTSKLPVTGLCAGNSRGPVNSPHTWPVTWKMFPFDDVLIIRSYTQVHLISRHVLFIVIHTHMLISTQMTNFMRWRWRWSQIYFESSLSTGFQLRSYRWWRYWIGVEQETSHRISQWLRRALTQ